MTLFDTNVISEYLKAGCAERTPMLHAFVKERLAQPGAAISYVTHFEITRWLTALDAHAEGKSKMAAYTLFVEVVQVLGLDGASGEGWNLAAALWAKGRLHKPAIVFSDADLLIAATAAYHERELATLDFTLSENLKAIGFPQPVTVLANA